MIKAQTLKTALVTGANGYIGNAVAKAFRRAGWNTYGLVRRSEGADELARHEIRPVTGTPEDLSFLDRTDGAVFDVIVSNTEDPRHAAAHLGMVRTMMDEVVRRSQAAGVRPLVMFSSGCKDYGPMAQRHGDPALAPHTEASPLSPPEVLAARCQLGLTLLDKRQTAYDAIVLRPTIVYGLASSHYGALFDLASKSADVLKLVADPDAIMHACHVDVCAKAYVMLAELKDRGQVVGQAFNISNASYETARQVGEALARSYGLTLKFGVPEGDVDMRTFHGLANFSQWVGSDKIRGVLGWKERRPTFVDGIEEYRIAYEASSRARSA